MTGNRREYTNAVHLGAMLKWVVAAIFVGVAGLNYVYLSNQMHARGNEISKLEKELADVRVRNEEAEAKITQLSSRAALQRRRNEGFIKMIAITDDRIVRINATASVPGNEIRAVAYRGMER